MTDPAGQRKARGAFFTPAAITAYLAGWAIRSPADRVLEPSCGEAGFLIAAGERLRALGAPAERLGGPVAGGGNPRRLGAAGRQAAGRAGSAWRHRGRRLLRAVAGAGLRCGDRQPALCPLPEFFRRGARAGAARGAGRRRAADRPVQLLGGVLHSCQPVPASGGTARAGAARRVADGELRRPGAPLPAAAVCPRAAGPVRHAGVSRRAGGGGAAARRRAGRGAVFRVCSRPAVRTRCPRPTPRPGPSTGPRTGRNGRRR